MKLILAIMSNDDSPTVSNALTKEQFQVTRLATTGGFLRSGNTTLIVGTEDERVERAMEVIGEYSRRRSEVIPSTTSYDMGRFTAFPTEVQIGGATIFVIDVEQFVKI
ncbi:MAG: cyclic-di-AMP receptor [Erysipelotrichaceae bacterium]|nr:cyclic-di-AMP receptor [Erysipelotrichaceae bacterium]